MAQKGTYSGCSKSCQSEGTKHDEGEGLERYCEIVAFFIGNVKFKDAVEASFLYSMPGSYVLVLHRFVVCNDFLNLKLSSTMLSKICEKLPETDICYRGGCPVRAYPVRLLTALSYKFRHQPLSHHAHLRFHG